MAGSNAATTLNPLLAYSSSYSLTFQFCFCCKVCKNPPDTFYLIFHTKKFSCVKLIIN